MQQTMVMEMNNKYLSVTDAPLILPASTDALLPHSATFSMLRLCPWL
jgi:hypothetical protein